MPLGWRNPPAGGVDAPSSRFLLTKSSNGNSMSNWNRNCNPWKNWLRSASPQKSNYCHRHCSHCIAAGKLTCSNQMPAPFSKAPDPSSAFTRRQSLNILYAASWASEPRAKSNGSSILFILYFLLLFTGLWPPCRWALPDTTRKAERSLRKNVSHSKNL